MTEDSDIRARFWATLHADRTIMLGLSSSDAPPRPMTALTTGDHDHGPIWIFTARDTELGEAVVATTPAFFTFVSKGHDIFATVHGLLSPHNDRAMIDSLWNPFVAAWYPEGKDDPSLLLLRFDPSQAEIWLNGSSLLAGLKMLFGADPKADYQDHVTKGPLA